MFFKVQKKKIIGLKGTLSVEKCEFEFIFFYFKYLKKVAVLNIEQLH